MSEGGTDEEWRKRITATLRSAPTFVLIDNLRRRLESGALSSALTASYLEDRLMSTSDIARLPVRCVWIATGNNPVLSTEVMRRSVRIRLDAKQDQPWMRRSFRHDPLRTWIAEERGNLVAACHTLIRAWIAAGRPVPAGAPILGSFEEYCRVLAGVLHVAGIAGFLGNLATFYEASDGEGDAIRAFLGAWWERYPNQEVGVAQLYPIVQALPEGIDLGDRGEKSQKTRLGRFLGQLRDRRYALPPSPFCVCIRLGRVEHGSQLWKLVAEIEGDVADVGDVFTPNARGTESMSKKEEEEDGEEKRPPRPQRPPDATDGVDPWHEPGPVAA